MNWGIILSLLISISAFGADLKPLNDAPNLSRATVLPVPLVRQATEYSCGAATLLSVLYYWKAYDGGEASLYGPLHTTQDGTNSYEMAKFAVSRGLNVDLRQNVSLNDIQKALTRGEPVIVDFQAWSGSNNPNYSTHWEDGHFAVIVGMDNDNIYFMDPVTPASYAYLTKKDFLSRWHDYEVIDDERIEYYQLAIFIRGTERLPSLPAPLKSIR